MEQTHKASLLNLECPDNQAETDLQQWVKVIMPVLKAASFHNGELVIPTIAVKRASSTMTCLPKDDSTDDVIEPGERSLEELDPLSVKSGDLHEQGQLTADGIYYYQSGCVYEGSLKAGFTDGQGRMVWKGAGYTMG